MLPVEAGARAAAQAAKARLHAEAGGGSDHLALVEAFQRWCEARARGQERRLTAQFFLSGATLNMIDGMRTQLAGELQAHFFPSHVPWALPSKMTFEADDRPERSHVAERVPAGRFPFKSCAFP